MKKAILYTQDGCGWCDDAKEEIKQMKKNGTLCYDFKEIKITKKNEGSVPSRVKMTPTVEIDGQFVSWGEAKRMCPIK